MISSRKCSTFFVSHRITIVAICWVIEVIGWVEVSETLNLGEDLLEVSFLTVCLCLYLFVF